MTPESWINLSIVIVYMVGMLGLGLWLARFIRGGDDYFIAGRSLNRWVICGSIMATNVAAVYLVGPAGKAFESGTPLLLMAWSGNMLAAIAAVTFLPRFRRLGVSTITELLERRYGQPVSISVSAIWIIFYALFSGVTMMTCATIITGAFGVPESFRLPGLDAFETITMVIAGVVILYCLASRDHGVDILLFLHNKVDQSRAFVCHCLLDSRFYLDFFCHTQAKHPERLS